MSSRDGEGFVLSDAAATFALCALAVGITAFGWLGKDVSLLAMSATTFWERPWQTLSSVLPHGNFIHLLFNVTMAFPLGRRIEAHYGSLKTLLFYAILGAGSMAAEYGVFRGGIGLSGVVYGQWGFLWIASKHSREFASAVDSRTNTTFIVWFFFCIAATYVDALQIANVAHAVGALLGILTAYAMTTKRRWQAAAALLGTLIAVGLSATVLRPWINISGLASDFETRAFERVESNLPEALELQRKAAKHEPKNARIIYNLGVLEHRAGNDSNAFLAFQKACALAPPQERARFCGVLAEDTE